MGRGVAVACLACLLCHGLSYGQTPLATAAPMPGAGQEATAANSSANAVNTGNGVMVPPMPPGMPTASPGAYDSGPSLGSDQGNGASGGIIPGVQMWAGLEFLMYFMSGTQVTNPLITNGVNDNVRAGALDQTGTQVLIGQRPYNDGTFYGMRARVGADLCDTGVGFEAIGFILDQMSTNLTFPSPTSNAGVIGLPYNDVNAGVGGVLQVRRPDDYEGGANFRLRTNLSGAEVNLGYAVDAGIVDWAYVGYRYLNLTETLTLRSSLLTLQDNVAVFQGVIQPNGRVISTADSFGTGNNFNGGQFGVVKRFTYRNVALDVRSALAFGDTRQRVSIGGFSTLGTVNADRSVTTNTIAQGGLYAQRSNIGTVITNQFSVVPEVGASLYVRLFDGLLGFVGYNFLYWTNVVRPGGQIDPNIQVQQVPSNAAFTGVAGNQPGSTFRRTDLTVHGLNAGLAIQF